MASFDFKTKPIPNVFLGVDRITPEYNCSASVKNLRGIWVYIGGTAHYFECDQYTVCNPDTATEDGHRQAFDLFKELYDMSPCDRQEVFGKITMLDLVSKNTYEDIVEKLDTWKKEKETIHVRDEVYSQAYETKFVVTKICAPCGGVVVNGLKKDGTAVKGLLLCNLKKTGLHVDDLDAYLEV